MNFLAVAIGGSIGALLRYGVNHLSAKLFASNFAWGTLIANLSGSFIIGLLWGLFDIEKMNNNIKNLVFIGILGSFTTFSTYTLESFNFLKAGDYKLFFINFFLQNALGFLFVFLGFLLGKIMKQ